MTPTLRTQGLSKRWGAFNAVSDVTLAFAPGARHALIGPNGAGKTTFINLLTGVFPPSAGDVLLGDERITALPQHQRVKRGMTRTFQINTLFPGLTVLESVVLAICERDGRASVWHRTVAQQRAASEEANALLDTLRLTSERNETTRNLAYGKQRLLEIALALATKPAILLLDEPAAGIPSGESAELFTVIAQLPRRDDPVHRARHGPRVPLRRAHHRARVRKGAHRRQAVRDRRRSTGEGGLPRRGAA